MNTQSRQDNPTSLTEWSNEPSLRQLKQDLESAKIESDTQVSKVDIWLDNLHVKGTAKLNKIKNRSNIQPKLIRKQAEWRYSSLSEPFLSTPDVFNVSPVTAEDRKAAQQNELVLNHQFNTQLNKVAFIDAYVRAGVNQGTVIVRTGWEFEEEEVEVEQNVFDYRPASEEYVASLAQISEIVKSDPSRLDQLPVEIKESLKVSTEIGRPVEAVMTGTELVTEVKVKHNRPTATVCDYRDVIVDPSCEGDGNKAKFVIYKFTSSKEELRSAGDMYSNIDKIMVEQNSPLADPDEANPDNSNFNFEDEARKKFTAYEYWGYWDIDGDGTVKPIVATWVGDTLIRMEENPLPGKEIPFIFVPYLPVDNSIYGEPDGELIKDNQDIVGAVTRGMVDIMGINANGQRGIRRDALDAINKRKFEAGKDFEFNANIPSADAAFYTGKFPEIPVSAQFMLQTQNAEAESMSGVKAFTGGISGQALGDTATGIRGALDASSKRELGILRRLAEGILEIGRKFIRYNSEFLLDEEIVRITNNNHIAIKREELAGAFDLKLSISTAEEDNQKASELAFMLQTVGPNSDQVLVRMIQSEIARLRKMPDLAKRIEEYEPEPDPIQQAIAQLEVKKLELEIAELSADVQLKQAQAQLALAKAREAGSNADKKDLDFIEQESGVTQERELQKQGEQARANAGLEVVKSQLNNTQQSSPNT